MSTRRSACALVVSIECLRALNFKKRRVQKTLKNPMKFANFKIATARIFALVTAKVRENSEANALRAKIADLTKS